MDNQLAELMLNQHSVVQLETPPAGSLVQLINNSFILDVVQRIYNVRNLKNFIFYISEKLNLNNQGGYDFFQKFWQSFPLVPRIFVRRANNSPRSIIDLISTPTLVLICTTEPNDPIMEVAAQSLKGMRWLKTIFILFPRLSKEERSFDSFSNLVKGVLDWSWSKQFTNTLLLTIQDHVYFLQPYPTPRIVNKTRSWRTRDLFKSDTINMKGYIIRTPIFYDMPRVFRGADQKVYGTSANFFIDFLEFVNASLVDTSANLTMKQFELTNLLELVSQGVYETLIHSFTDLIGNYSVSISYPMGINDWCIMVPYRNESLQELYVQEALQSNVWLLLLFFVVYMCFAIWLCSPSRPRDISAAMLQCICSITNNPPMNIIKVATPRMRFLYIIFFIMGLNCSNMYISKMASYLASELPPRQLNTLQDIIDADLRILVQSYEYNRLIKTPHQYTPRFLQQVDVVDVQVIQEHRDKLNASFGYFVPTDRWSFINMQQAHLHSPIFRLTEICSGPFYHVYPMHLDSHLRSPHQNFILIAQQAGLRYYWIREAFWEALHLRRFKLFVDDDEPRPLSMGFFSSMMRLWCWGLVVAGLTFVLEMKWHELALLKRQLKWSRSPQRIFKRARRN